MAGLAFAKMLLVASLLYLYCDSSDASLARVSSVAAGVVEQSLPARVYSNVFGNSRQNRFKREVVTKKLDDPKGCIQECRNNETAAILTATMKNLARLLAIALKDVKGDETSTPEKEAAFKKQVEEKTIANMGPLFDDLCSTSKTADNCFAQCPDSKLRTITTLDHSTTEALCEPSKNWKSFSDYWNALNCTNATQIDSPCDSKCGAEREISNVTNLKIDEDEDSERTTLRYETDSKKNTAAAGPACKTISCQIDCYKPIMTERCGAKAYDLYSRMEKLEPRSSLSILKFLNAVDDTSECKSFQ